MVNIVVRQDFGLEFLAKAKPLRATVPRSRPRPRPAYCKAKAKATKFGQGLTSLLKATMISLFTLYSD